MKTQAMLLTSLLTLVACGGSGVPWEGEQPAGSDAAVSGGTSAAGGGATSVGASSGKNNGGLAMGGYQNVGGTLLIEGGVGGESEEPVAGGDESAGGESIGGTSCGGGAGTDLPQGGYEVGGESSEETGGAGPAEGGSGGYENGGEPDHEACLLNVAHCFDAAANCFQYSPRSDCDQIVDVCAAMQAKCGP